MSAAVTGAHAIHERYDPAPDDHSRRHWALPSGSDATARRCTDCHRPVPHSEAATVLDRVGRCCCCAEITRETP